MPTNGHKITDRIIAEASCTCDGLMQTDVCADCGYIASTSRYQVINGKHIVQGEISTITDCTGTYEEFCCSACGETVSMRISDTANPSRHRSPGYDFITPNSCLKAGEGYMMCSACGWKADLPDVIPASHSWQKDITVRIAPSCGTIGYGSRICEVCGEEKCTSDGASYLFTIPATGLHNFDTFLLDSGSCTLESYMVHECTECGAMDSEENMAKLGISYLDPIDTGRTMLSTAIEIIPAGTHVFDKAVYTPASCTTSAGMTRSCIKCGSIENITAESPALGHDFVVATTEPSCYADGSTVTSCYRCGVISKSYKLPATSHSMRRDEEDARNVSASCSATGIQVYECENGCGYDELKITPINLQNHDWEILNVFAEANCATGAIGMEQRQCRLCGKIGVYNVAPEHSWDDGTVLFQPDCVSEGLLLRSCTACSKATNYVAIERLPHSLISIDQPASCTKEEGVITRCENCDLVTSFVKTGSTCLPHIFSEKRFVAATCTSAGGYEQICEREGCDVRFFEADPVNYPAFAHYEKTLVRSRPATCMSPASNFYFCSLCKNEIREDIGALDYISGHDWKITKTYTDEDVSCKNPGYVDRECTICGAQHAKVYFRPDHVMSDIVFQKEYTYRYCEVCGEIDCIWIANSFGGFSGCTRIASDKDGNRIMVGAHKGLVIEASKDASCTEDGMVGYIGCSTCGTVIQERRIIPAGHKASGGNKASCTKLAVCDLCGAEFGSYADHEYVYCSIINASSHAYRCACGAIGATENHSFAGKDGVISCTACSFSKVCDSPDLRYVETGDGEHELICGICGYQS